MNKPIIRLRFPEARGGYWDGGPKDGGDFEVENCQSHPGKEQYIQWGCFRLNFWFETKAGRSWKEAANVAQKRLRNMLRVPGTTVKIISQGKEVKQDDAKRIYKNAKGNTIPNSKKSQDSKLV